MEFLAILLSLAVVWFLYSMSRTQARPNGGVLHCMTCGTDSVPKVKTDGSLVIEIILWLCFLVPGLIYSIWRSTTKAEVCYSCSSKQLVPLDATAAAAHKRQLQM